MSNHLYRDFLNLFKHWPIDATKKGRDLGEHIRKKFSQSFQQGELSDKSELKYWTKTYNDLKRLENDEFSNKYPRTKSTGALGIGKVQCRVVLSNSSMEYLGVIIEKKN
jgi:nucleoid factor 1